MDKIESFKIDHNKLNEGIYLSRVDGDVSTYDLRTRKPNIDDLMDNATMHSLEHMFATFVRNSDIKEQILYFGPMGCQTGFYLLVRNADNKVVERIVKQTLEKIINHDGEMFGASAVECGNYKNLSLDLAKEESKRYLAILNSKVNTFLYE